MCVPGLDPVTAAVLSAGVSGAGAAYNASSQNNMIEEQTRQNNIREQENSNNREAERVRQRAFEAAQAEEVTKALFEAAPAKVEEQAAVAAADESNPIVSAAEEYNVPVLTGQVQNEDVNESIGSTIKKAMERTKGMLRSAATLSEQGVGLSQGAESLTRMGSNIQTIGSNRAASGAVGQYEASLPSADVRATGNPLGDLLLLGGQLGAASSGRTIGVDGGTAPFDIGSIFKNTKAA